MSITTKFSSLLPVNPPKVDMPLVEVDTSGTWREFIKAISKLWRRIFNTETTSSVVVSQIVAPAVSFRLRNDCIFRAPVTPVLSSSSSTPYKPPVPKSRSDLVNELNEICGKLNETRKSGIRTRPLHMQDPLPKRNFGNTCYFNAALQTIEATYLSDPSCQAILEMDLASDDLRKLEANPIFHAWMPLTDFATQDLAPLKARKEQLEQQFQPIPKNTFVNQATLDAKRAESLQIQRLGVQIFEIDSEQKKSTYEDRILFKWSLLVLWQAEKYGTSEEKRKALAAHKDLFSGMQQLEADAGIGQYQQNDSYAYLTFLYDKMPIKKGEVSYNDAKEGNQVWATGEVHFAKGDPLIQLACKDSFQSALQAFSLNKNENTIRYAQMAEDKLKKEKELVAKPDDIELKKQIDRMEYNLNHRDHWKGFPDFDEHHYLTDTPPEVLSFHIKRFEMDATGAMNKITSPLPFKKEDQSVFNRFFSVKSPYLEPLNLDKYFDPNALQNGEHAHYELTGFVLHQGVGAGNSSGGHYVSYVRRGDQWFYVSDDTVTKKSISDVPFDQAYILTYKRLPKAN